MPRVLATLCLATVLVTGCGSAVGKQDPQPRDDGLTGESGRSSDGQASGDPRDAPPGGVYWIGKNRAGDRGSFSGGRQCYGIPQVRDGRVWAALGEASAP